MLSPMKTPVDIPSHHVKQCPGFLHACVYECLRIVHSYMLACAPMRARACACLCAHAHACLPAFARIRLCVHACGRNRVKNWDTPQQSSGGWEAPTV